MSDVLLAWIIVGMDGTENGDVTPAAYYTEVGAVEESSGTNDDLSTRASVRGWVGIDSEESITTQAAMT